MEFAKRKNIETALRIVQNKKERMEGWCRSGVEVTST